MKNPLLTAALLLSGACAIAPTAPLDEGFVPDGLAPVPARADWSAELSHTLDVSRIARGGVDQGSAVRGLLDLALTIEGEAALWLEGATVGLDAYALGGDDGSALAGDLQGFSNIDGEEVGQIAELWWEQRLLDDRLRIKVGKVDANSEFAAVAGGGGFIGSSFGFSPTIFPLPTYPDPATSVNVFWNSEAGLTGGLGVYDGVQQEGIRTGGRGPGTFLGAPSDLFLIAELGRSYARGVNGRAGRVAAGSWHHTGTFERFEGGESQGTEGLYLAWDQKLGGAPRELDLFLQLGLADERVSEVATHLGTGLVWPGAIPWQEDSLVGAGTSWVWLSDRAGFDEDYEAAFEVFARLRLGEHFTLQPDVQYIVRPGGASDVDDALVLTLRAVFSR